MIESPCLGLCCLSDDKLYCIGCFRTTEEIRLWGRMTDDQKLCVLTRINAQKTPTEN